MSRLADYFVVVGYDHEKERKYNDNFQPGEQKEKFQVVVLVME